MMEVTSPSAGPANGLPTTSGGGYQFDPLIILDHLAQVCEITLGATRKDLENVGSLLSKARVSETTQRVQRWADSQAALYIQKDHSSSSSLNGVLDESSMLIDRPSCILKLIFSYQVQLHTATLSRPTFLIPHPPYPPLLS
jgi:dynein heavy chain 1